MSATTSLLRSMTLAFALAAALPGPALAGMAGSIVAIFTPAPEGAPAGCTWALLDPESREERVYSRSAACPDLLVWDPAGRRTVYVDGDRVLQLDWRAGAAPAELGRLPPSAAPPQDAVDQTLWLAAGTGAVRIARFARAEGPAQWLEPGVLGVPYGGRLLRCGRTRRRTRSPMPRCSANRWPATAPSACCWWTSCGTAPGSGWTSPLMSCRSTAR